ncbi:uncharacterized protein LOC143657020 [Tamandua tetradactyla]|uniref:uncharacterized protein LOC143657020 n=1 Tax=Tamandua tetradactyla TaxID=48850 RepID=UPI004054533A
MNVRRKYEAEYSANAKLREVSTEDSELLGTLGYSYSLATALGLITSCLSRLPALRGRSLAYHRSTQCVYGAGQGWREDWSSSASLLTVSTPGENQCQTTPSYRASRVSSSPREIREFSSPTSPPNIVYLSINEKGSPEGRNVAPGPVQASTSDRSERPPSFHPIVPLKDSS